MGEPPARAIIGLDAAALVQQPCNAVWLQSLVSAAEHGPDISVTWVHIAGHHRRLRTNRSTRVYVLVSGVLHIQLGDARPAQIPQGGVAVVPRDTPYELDGTATYLVINAPAFVDGDDHYE